MFNSVLNKMQPSASMKTGLAENIKPVTNLAIGVPDLNCPDEVIEIIKNGAESRLFNYVPSKGTSKALINLKKIIFNNAETIVPGKNLMLVNGAKFGIYLSLKTICNVNDSVILMQPYWLSYPEIVNSLNLNFQSWNPIISDDGNLEYEFENLEHIIKENNVSVLVLNNPNNPSGKIFKRDWIVELNSLLKKNKVWLVIDEVYKDLIFNPDQNNNFIIEDENIIRVGSLSKSLSIPGMRLGYIYASESFISNADLFNQHIQTCVNSLSCYLMENLDYNTYHLFARKCSDVYVERYEALKKVLQHTKLNVLQSEAAFYTLIDFRNYFQSGADACLYLADQLNILAVPGLPYGNKFGTYVRVCLTVPEETLTAKFNLLDNQLKHENF